MIKLRLLLYILLVTHPMRRMKFIILINSLLSFQVWSSKWKMTVAWCPSFIIPCASLWSRTLTSPRKKDKALCSSYREVKTNYGWAAWYNPTSGTEISRWIIHQSEECLRKLRNSILPSVTMETSTWRWCWWDYDPLVKATFVWNGIQHVRLFYITVDTGVLAWLSRGAVLLKPVQWWIVFLKDRRFIFQSFELFTFLLSHEITVLFRICFALLWDCVREISIVMCE